MNPEEFISLAGRIVHFGPAGARSAISRAYYGAFHLAHHVLSEIGCAPKGGGSHSQIPNYLDCAADPEIKKAAGLLKDLHNCRIKADYRMHDSQVESAGVARLYIEMAIDVQTQLIRFRATLSDRAVAEALKHRRFQPQDFRQLKL